MPKRKLSSSYIRKREDIKNAVTKRSVEKIRIAGQGPGYRTSGQIKGGNILYLGSPAGTKIKVNAKTGNQTTEAKRKARNRNSTPNPGQRPINVKAKSKPTVAKVLLRPGKPTKPYAGRAKPILRKRSK